MGLFRRVPRRFWRKFTKTKLYNYIPDKADVKIKYRNHFLKKLDLKNPKTFNEKLQWLKLYNRNPLYTTMVDKYAVKKYVADRIGEEYTIPTLGIWDSFDEIDFDILPEKFVLKCTHGSGDTVICKNKKSFNVDYAKKIIEESLNTDYYLVSREWPYKNVPRRIIAEEYVEDSTIHEARDYKFFCFNGEVKCFKVDFDRYTNHKANWFYPNRELIKYGEEICPPDFEKNIELPDKLSEMITLAETLSKDIPFIRVDFYYINDKILFGELTFFPASGLLKYTDYKWDLQLGEWLELPNHQYRS